MVKLEPREREITITDVGRSLLNSLALAGTALLLLVISIFAFFVFYHHNVPAMGVREEIHLQYHTGSQPHAMIDLDFSPSRLATSQPYDIVLQMVVPNTPNNHDIGNFMVELDILGTDALSIVHSARPTILRYASPLIDTVSTVLSSAPILLGLKEESQTLNVNLLRHFQFESGWLIGPSQAKIQIHAPSLQVYSSALLFQTRLEGLAWFLRTFRITSFVLFTLLFWLSSLTFMLVSWTFITFAILPSPSPPSDKNDRDGGHQKDKTTLGTSLPAIIKKEAGARDQPSPSASSNLFAEGISAFPRVRQGNLRHPASLRSATARMDSRGDTNLHSTTTMSQSTRGARTADMVSFFGHDDDDDDDDHPDDLRSLGPDTTATSVDPDDDPFIKIEPRE